MQVSIPTRTNESPDGQELLILQKPGDPVGLSQAATPLHLSQVGFPGTPALVRLTQY